MVTRNSAVKEFTSEKVSRVSSIELDAAVEKVFPLFGPILEKEWAAGWNPEILYSETGLVEEHMIFRTQSHHLIEDHYTWVITKYIPEEYEIEYMVSTPDRVWFIHIKCKPASSKTVAAIRYTYVGLTEKGNSMNRDALEKMYGHDLRDWEEAINYYLHTGKLLTQ